MLGFFFITCLVSVSVSVVLLFTPTYLVTPLREPQIIPTCHPLRSLAAVSSHIFSFCLLIFSPLSASLRWGICYDHLCLQPCVFVFSHLTLLNFQTYNFALLFVDSACGSFLLLSCSTFLFVFLYWPFAPIFSCHTPLLYSPIVFCSLSPHVKFKSLVLYSSVTLSLCVFFIFLL